MKIFHQDFCLEYGPNDVENSPTTGLSLSQNQLSEVAAAVFTLHTQQICGHIRLIFQTAEEVQTFEEQYKRFFIPITAAGGIILDNKEKNKLLFIERRGFWDLPKGKMDEGETPFQTALREVEEETGLPTEGESANYILSYHIYYEKEHWYVKKTYWYVLYADAKHPLKLQADEGITQALWLPIGELNSLFNQTYASIRAVLTDWRKQSLE